MKNQAFDNLIKKIQKMRPDDISAIPYDDEPSAKIIREAPPSYIAKLIEAVMSDPERFESTIFCIQQTSFKEGWNEALAEEAHLLSVEEIQDEFVRELDTFKGWAAARLRRTVLGRLGDEALLKRIKGKKA